MISNSSPPRTTPLTPLNNSPFSRGSRAVHQGQKKAKAYNISIAEADCEISSGLAKDGGINNGQLMRSPGETSPNQACDSTSLTPISKGILKRKREAEMEADDGNGVTCSKKKVIFANPISATKLIESRKSLTPKTARKRRLRYEEPTEGLDSALNDQQPQPEPEAVNKQSESEITTSIADVAVNNPDSENSDPIVESNNAKQAKVEGKIRKAGKMVNPPSNRDIVKSSKESNNQIVIDSTVNVDPLSKKIGEHSNISNTEEIENSNITSKDGSNKNSDEVFNKIESLLQVIESQCANKSSSSSIQVDPVIDADVITETQIEDDNNLEALLLDCSTKSDSINEKEDSKSDMDSLSSPIGSPDQETAELNEEAAEQVAPVLTKPDKIEETAMEVEESIQPSATKPLLESWVNAKKSVDLFIQSYCTMLTSKMKNWLSVKGINTIGDFANLVGTSSNRLTESPICPLNEETILSTFQFMIDQNLNKESSSVELNEMIEDREQGDMIKESETIKEINKMESDDTKTKGKNFITLKVMMPVLPLEISSKISPDTPSSGEYFDASEDIISSPKLVDEMDFSDATIELSSEDEFRKVPLEINKKPPVKSTTSSIKDNKPKKIPSEKISEDNQTKVIPKKKNTNKSAIIKKDNSKKSMSKNDVPAKGTKKTEPIHEESVEKDSLSKETDKNDSPPKDSPEKNSEKDSLSTIGTKSCEHSSEKVALNSKPRIDPTTIVPRAAIVIKRLTDDEIIEFSRPKVTTISVEITEMELTEDKGDTQLTGSTSENKPIEEESTKVNELPPSSLSFSSKDENTKNSLSVELASSQLRKSRRKRDSESPAILPVKSRTRRRTVGVKFD